MLEEDRRGFLKCTLSASAVTTLVSALYSSAERTGHNFLEESIGERLVYGGIPEPYVQDSEKRDRIDRYLEDNFRGDIRSIEEVDGIFDFRYVEGEELSGDIPGNIEQEFRSQGIDIMVLERKESYPRNPFLQEYGCEVSSITGSWVDPSGSFWSEEIEEFMREVALQVVFVPGKQEGPYRGLIKNDLPFLREERDYALGQAVGDRAVIAGMDKREELTTDQHYKVIRWNVTRHEIGHGVGARHIDRSDCVMTRKELESVEQKLPYSESSRQQMEDQLV